jgi:hypothetical protein
LDGGETHQDDTDIGEPAMDFGATILDSKTLTPHKLHRSFGFGNRCSKAICIGDEVSTVDWHGVVTVRDRDNASKVLGTIPTDRRSVPGITEMDSTLQ